MLLSRVESVTQLSLRGTPVTDAFVAELVDRWKLEYLDVVDTRVGTECLRRIRSRDPNLRTHPRVAGDQEVAGPYIRLLTQAIALSRSVNTLSGQLGLTSQRVAVRAPRCGAVSTTKACALMR